MKVSIKDMIIACRPNQWSKNAVVLAAFFFAYFDRKLEIGVGEGLSTVLPAALLFCLVSSAIYLLNDIRDVNADRAHPLKQFRPIASGRIPIPFAWSMCLVLLVTGMVGARLLSPAFATVVCCYVIIQLAYSFGLKHIALLDIFVIAAGFVLRAIAGAVVLQVPISPWLLLCTFLLAMFLALCKRRHEKINVDDGGQEGRRSLEYYDPRVLDLLVAITASSTIVCYAIYTLTGDTIEKFGTDKLAFTVPFVMFGVFRYLDLVYRHEQGDRPEKTLLTDIPTLVNVFLYGLSVIAICLLTG
jgi:4-hydroxybenzoate polyprenyltransferase